MKKRIARDSSHRSSALASISLTIRVWRALPKLLNFAPWERARSLVEAKASPKMSCERTRNGLKPAFPDRKRRGISENSALEGNNKISCKDPSCSGAVGGLDAVKQSATIWETFLFSLTVHSPCLFSPYSSPARAEMRGTALRKEEGSKTAQVHELPLNAMLPVCSWTRQPRCTSAFCLSQS